MVRDDHGHFVAGFVKKYNHVSSHHLQVEALAAIDGLV